LSESGRVKEESEWKRRPVDRFKRVKVSKGVGSKELKKKMRKNGRDIHG
jgi:hypothetical protein